MKNKGLNIVAGFLLGGLGAATASATTMSEAIQLALESNPDVRVETNEVLSRQQEIKQAEAGYYPQVDVTAAAGIEHSDNSSTRAAGFDKRELSRKEAELNVRQMLFDGYATVSEVERQAARTQSAEYRVSGVSQNTALDAARAFIEVIKNQQLLELSEGNLQAHSRIFDQVKLRNEAGIGRSSDLEQVRGRRASANASRLADVANLKDAETNYLRVVGDLPRDLQPPQSLKGVLPTSLNEAVQVALADHPTLASANADVRATLAQHKAAKNPYYPRFDLELGSSWSENRDGVVGDENDMTAMVRMRYNLFAGGRDKARQLQTAHLIEEAKEVRNRTHRQVVESLRLSWVAYEATQAQLASLQQHLVSSEKTRDAYVQQFNIGKRTLIDLLNTENEVFEAKRDYLAAQWDNRFAEYRILVGTGHLLDKLALAAPSGTGLGDEALSSHEALAPQSVLAGNFDQRFAVEQTPVEVAADPAIMAQVEAWRDAWQGRNVDAYLGAYSPSFEPSDGQSLASWRNQRQRIIGGTKDIFLELSQIEIDQSGDRAVVNFVQRYRSDSYRDLVNKRLELAKEAEGWRIVRETSR